MQALDKVYTQRNELAVAFAKAALAAGWPAGRGFDPVEATDGWGHVVYVDLPDGSQVSWHIAPSEVHLLGGLPEYPGRWDGKFTGHTPGWSQRIEVQV